MRNAGLDEAQAGIKIARRNINNLRYEDDTTFMAEREEELKILLMKVKEESEKVVIKESRTGFDILYFTLGEQMVTTAMQLKDTYSLEGSYDPPR